MWLFNLLFSTLSQLWYVEVRISRSILVSPLEFEITRVDCTSVVRKDTYVEKKGKRKVQGVPQSQTAALPRPQEEEETDKSKQAQTELTYEKH